MIATTPSRDGVSGGPPAGPSRVPGWIAIVLAVAGQVVVGFFTVTAIGLIGMPVWAALLLTVVWAAGVFTITRLAWRRPLLAPVVPILGALVLWGVVAAGGAWLGWTA
jgi:hypothetical protein